MLLVTVADIELTVEFTKTVLVCVAEAVELAALNNVPSEVCPDGKLGITLVISEFPLGSIEVVESNVLDVFDNKLLGKTEADSTKL